MYACSTFMVEANIITAMAPSCLAGLEDVLLPAFSMSDTAYTVVGRYGASEAAHNLRICRYADNVRKMQTMYMHVATCICYPSQLAPQAS